jgi:hypothetical protein
MLEAKTIKTQHSMFLSLILEQNAATAAAEMLSAVRR